MNISYLALTIILLVVVCVIAKLFSLYKGKRIKEGYTSSDSSFKLNSKFQYVEISKRSMTKDNIDDTLDFDDADIYIDIKNKDGTIFTISNKNNATLSTDTDKLTLDLGSCMYYVSQIDKIIIQCGINDNTTNSNDYDKIVKRNSPKVTNPYKNISLIDCQNQTLATFDFDYKIDLDDDVALDNTDSDNRSFSFILYNSLSYSSENDLLTQLENKYSNTVFVITTNFTFPQNFVQNKTLQKSLADPSLLASTVNTGEEDATTAPDCASTPYGCCRDGKTTSQNLRGTNCPPLPCTQSTFGCCRDGVTPSFDLLGTNCPQRKIESQS